MIELAGEPRIGVEEVAGVAETRLQLEGGGGDFCPAQVDTIHAVDPRTPYGL